MIISIIVEITIFLIFVKIKNRMITFNILYNQKILYPYLTTRGTLPHILPTFIINLIGSRGIAPFPRNSIF